VFENRVLRGIFEPERLEVAGGCTRLYNEELHNLYASPNIIRILKSSRMRWAGHVARIGMMSIYTKFWQENLKEETTRRT
jgi:hypothetical protein